MRALVIRGTRNIFTLRPEPLPGGKGLPEKGGEIECGLKGKVLKGVEGFYNPLAPGDIVEIEGGLITGLEKRVNTFARFNQKGQAPQLLAANVDLVVCVTTAFTPPFRPRFIDRVLFQAEYSGIRAVLVLNKADLGEADAQTRERLLDYRRIGYEVFDVSARTGEGMDEFRSFLRGKFSVLTGQSGVGKSSLVKALIPDLKIKTGALNEKYNRGNHTTTQSALMELPLTEAEVFEDEVSEAEVSARRGGFSFRRTSVVDTPGIRRFAPERVPASDVILYMREFAPLAGLCAFGLSCTHETENGCRVREEVEAGTIHEDRYESFLRIKDEMAELERYPDYD